VPLVSGHAGIMRLPLDLTKRRTRLGHPFDRLLDRLDLLLDQSEAR